MPGTEKKIDTPVSSNHIDYREAFVLDMEMAAHGYTCKQCQLAALRSNPDAFCPRFQHMQGYIKRAYEALPTYYKQRYEEARTTAVNESTEAIKQAMGR